jgi:flagellar protein FliO/FliZ
VALIPLYAQSSGGAAESNTPQDENSILLDAAPVAAQNAAGENERGLVLDGSSSGALGVFAVLRAVFILILAALAVYGVVFFLKKTMRRETREDSQLKLLASVPVSAKTSAAVISAGNKAWLLAVSESSISAIAEITDKETIDAMTLEYARRVESGAGNAVNFWAALKKILPPQTDKTKMPLTAGIKQTDKLRENRDKLRGL